jgi:uncharacterized protein YbcI
MIQCFDSINTLLTKLQTEFLNHINICNTKNSLKIDEVEKKLCKTNEDNLIILNNYFDLIKIFISDTQSLIQNLLSQLTNDTNLLKENF